MSETTANVVGDAVEPQNPPSGVGEGASISEAHGAVGEPVEDAETFPREYVEKLRAEAAEARVKAKRTEEAEARLRELAVAEAVRGILMDPNDMGWDDAYTDENGWPDHDKILAAAEEMVARRPHLARPRGDVGLGRRGETSDDVSLVGILARNA